MSVHRVKIVKYVVYVKLSKVIGHTEIKMKNITRSSSLGEEKKSIVTLKRIKKKMKRTEFKEI